MGVKFEWQHCSDYLQCIRRPTVGAAEYNWTGPYNRARGKRKETSTFVRKANEACYALLSVCYYSPFQKECPIWGPAAGDQLLLRPVMCVADVRPRGCREIALVSLARAAWAVAMQSAHARALLPALP